MFSFSHVAEMLKFERIVLMSYIISLTSLISCPGDFSLLL